MEPTQPVPAQQPLTPAPDPMREASKKGWKNIASTLAIILIAPILAIFITIFVFQSYEVFGMSMETTLQDGDRLIVQKFSKNWSRIRGREYIPQRHEIIVFDKPSFINNSSGNVDHLIKRVIALPGERVVLQNGKYTVYNQDNLQGFNPDEGQEYAKDILNTPGEVDITVGQGEVFVSGDNRNNSLDSRNFGSINAATITGIATIRFVPVNAFRRL